MQSSISIITQGAPRHHIYTTHTQRECPCGWEQTARILNSALTELQTAPSILRWALSSAAITGRESFRMTLPEAKNIMWRYASLNLKWKQMWVRNEGLHRAVIRAGLYYSSAWFPSIFFGKWRGCASVTRAAQLRVINVSCSASIIRFVRLSAAQRTKKVRKRESGGEIAISEKSRNYLNCSLLPLMISLQALSKRIQLRFIK